MTRKPGLFWKVFDALRVEKRLQSCILAAARLRATGLTVYNNRLGEHKAERCCAALQVRV